MPYDYIIIGAGSAGCVIANRLSANPSNTVLLLEAGHKDNDLRIHIPGAYSLLNHSKFDWGFYTEPQAQINNRRLYIPRGRVLGGSSSTNAMAYVRGHRSDYDNWAAQGNPGWDYASVLPLFKYSESHQTIQNEFHGADGPLSVDFAQVPHPMADAFITACEQAGFKRNDDYNGNEQLGAGLLQFNIKGNRRQSAAVAFLRPILHRPNLTVRTGAQVKKICLHGERVTAVEVYTGASSTELIGVNKEVILSAGAIQSPQILQCSGIGNTSLLTEVGIETFIDSPHVGQHLQDHLWSGVSALSNQPSKNSLLKMNQLAKAGLQQLLFKSGPLSNSPLEANAFWQSEGKDSAPDLQFHFVPLQIGNDYSTDIYDLNTFPKEDGFSIMSILLHPKSEGFVHVQSNETRVPPIIQPRFLTHEDDWKTLLKGLLKAKEIIEQPGLANITCNGIHLPVGDFDEATLRNHIIQSVETLYHPVGTCKMGVEGQAVVDHRLKVWGTFNLRVADAAIMPSIVSGNTHAACVLIGEKCALNLLNSNM